MAPAFSGAHLQAVASLQLWAGVTAVFVCVCGRGEGEKNGTQTSHNILFCYRLFNDVGSHQREPHIKKVYASTS